MKLAIFGLSISSSWGNGHATLWRGLCRALAARGHETHFFEKDVPYYAGHRDLTSLPAAHLHLYQSWEEIRPAAESQLRDSDIGMVTSYCPDAIAATDLVLSSAKFSCFYDLDTPVTLRRLRAGEPVEYLGARGLRDFDLVLSYTGGAALPELRSRLGAKRTVPLYGSVDPEQHYPAPPVEQYLSDLCYLGTYAEDRQQALEALFVEPARRLPELKFMIGGAMYPQDFPWTANTFFVQHVPPRDHPAFYCSSKLTVNVTRAAMAQMGYCPSGRLFEAAACGVPILTDDWVGLDEFFEPSSEILVAHDTDDAIAALRLSQQERLKIAHRARERVLDCHTSERRAVELEDILGASRFSEQSREAVEV